MTKDQYDIVIIGGGASGLMLAAQYDLKGSEGAILEGSLRIGSKLLMSGGGHCNITHGGSIKDFINAYGDHGPALRKSLYKHSNLELARWLDAHGVGLADDEGKLVDLSEGAQELERAGRVFPASMKARDVLGAFRKAASDNGWHIETGAKVSGLIRGERDAADAGSSGHDGLESGNGCCQREYWKITLEDGRSIKSGNVVIATGGITFPETGSDGSMLGILKGLGAEVTDTRPALSPVYVENYPYAELAGTSLPGVTVTAFSSDAACTCKGKAARMTGDILFTHEGLSGPAILNISGYTEIGEKIRLSYNKELSELPKRMRRVLTERARGASGDVKTSMLASLLDHDDLVVKSVDRRGMVTAGGVSLDALDMRTMKLKGFEGLYVIGEAIEAYGITGGYNLQLCWSTAGVAADDLKKTYTERDS